MELKGKAHKFGDDINTDYIISGKYKFKTLDKKELAKHVMEDIDPHFYERIEEGDLIVAGNNFGCGSSREQAPLAIKYAGISAVIAESFARIFYRNAINVGLPVIECEQVNNIEESDQLEASLDEGQIINHSQNEEYETKPLPGIMLDILQEGGLAEYMKKHRGYDF